MLKEESLIGSLKFASRMLTFLSNDLRKAGVINEIESKKLKTVFRTILSKSENRNYYPNLSALLEYMGFDDISNVKLYDLLVICAVLKNPGGFIVPNSSTTLKSMMIAYDNWGDVRKVTRTVNEIAQLENRPIMRIREWKNFSNNTVDVDISANSSVLKMYLNTILMNNYHSSVVSMRFKYMPSIDVLLENDFTAEDIFSYRNPK